MQKLKSRIQRMEKQLIPPLHRGAILVLPGDDENFLIQEYQHQHPGQPMPRIMRIDFVKSKNSN